MWRLGICLLFITMNVFAVDCKVYGISDSPQGMTCSFPELNLKLTCHNGTYYLNKEAVSVAFHMEVEDGPVPLVFKSSTMQLTATKLPDQKFQGDLALNSQNLQGLCE